MSNPFRYSPPTEDDEGEKFICHACVGEPLLKMEIKRQGTVQTCAYCAKTNHRCVLVKAFAERIDEVYSTVIRLAEETPEVYEESDRVSWVRNGDYPGALVVELVEGADDRIGDDVIEALSDLNWSFDDDFDWYDTSNDAYAIAIPDDPQYQDAWREFCHSVKHERRFFSTVGKARLDEIFGPILTGKDLGGVKAIRTIGPESDDRFVVRGRLGNLPSEREAIYASPIKQLGPPPADKASAGRMNPAGISVFYGSFEPDTCVAELRAPVGGTAVVGTFEIIRPLRILDLTVLEDARNRLSWFDAEFFKMDNYTRFIRGFHNEIKRSVIPGSEHLEYLPTQVVAEYLWTHSRHAVDGLIFGSSQLTDGNPKNIVIFPPACAVEGAATEGKLQVSRLTVSTDNDDDDRDDLARVVSEVVLVGGRAEPPANPDWSSAMHFGGFDDPPPAPAASLKLNLASIQRVSVSGISYKTASIPASYREEIDHDF